MALLPVRRKACWGFFHPKNPTASAGFEPANLGSKGQHATPRPTKPVHIYMYIYIYIHIYIYCALVGLENKMIKTHGTHIKYIDLTVCGNLLTFTFTRSNWIDIVHCGSKQWLNWRENMIFPKYAGSAKKCIHTLTKENSMLCVSTNFNYTSQVENTLQ